MGASHDCQPCTRTRITRPTWVQGFLTNPSNVADFRELVKGKKGRTATITCPVPHRYNYTSFLKIRTARPTINVDSRLRRHLEGKGRGMVMIADPVQKPGSLNQSEGSKDSTRPLLAPCSERLLGRRRRGKL